MRRISNRTDADIFTDFFRNISLNIFISAIVAGIIAFVLDSVFIILFIGALLGTLIVDFLNAQKRQEFKLILQIFSGNYKQQPVDSTPFNPEDLFKKKVDHDHDQPKPKLSKLDELKADANKCILDD